jgi:hypothetical protein
LHPVDQSAPCTHAHMQSLSTATSSAEQYAGYSHSNTPHLGFNTVCLTCMWCSTACSCCDSKWRSCFLQAAAAAAWPMDTCGVEASSTRGHTCSLEGRKQ